MSQHTPIRWGVTANVLRIEEADTGRLIATMPSQDPHHTRLFNARFIAKAPEMRNEITSLLADLDANRDRGSLTEIVLSHAPRFRALLKEIEGC